MNFIHTSNESHHLEGEIHQGGQKGQKAGEYLIHFHQKSEGKVNLGIDSSEFHFLLVPQCFARSLDRSVKRPGEVLSMVRVT